jgi:hypothetical protein
VVVALPVELARAGQLKPALVVLGHRLVEHYESLGWRGL